MGFSLLHSQPRTAKTCSFYFLNMSNPKAYMIFNYTQISWPFMVPSYCWHKIESVAWPCLPHQPHLLTPPREGFISPALFTCRAGSLLGRAVLRTTGCGAASHSMPVAPNTSGDSEICLQTLPSDPGGKTAPTPRHILCAPCSSGASLIYRILCHEGCETLSSGRDGLVPSHCLTLCLRRLPLRSPTLLTTAYYAD